MHARQILYSCFTPCFPPWLYSFFWLVNYEHVSVKYFRHTSLCNWYMKIVSSRPVIFPAEEQPCSTTNLEKNTMTIDICNSQIYLSILTTLEPYLDGGRQISLSAKRQRTPGRIQYSDTEIRSTNNVKKLPNYQTSTAT